MEEQELIITFRGNLALRNKITARTLSHSLSHLQRAIDKIVIYEQRGSIRKFSQLASNQYPLADLIVGQFEQGSVRIPLLSPHIARLGAKISDVLDRPYKEAAEHQRSAIVPLDVQIPDARNRVIRGISAGLDEQRLLKKAASGGVGWYTTAVLQDFNHLISPLRSSAADEDDAIELGVMKGARQKKYTFDADISRAFNAIVTEKRLGPETYFSGSLEGLERRKIGAFPYAGRFTSSESGLEMRLLVPTEKAALALNPYNLSRRRFDIWAAPLMVYDAFDEKRGDIVFLEFK